MKNKAILLRSVSAIATAAASTAGGVQHASAQALAPGANGYYYSATGGFALNPAESYLAEVEDKIGYNGDGYHSGYSSYASSGSGSSYSGNTHWQSLGESSSSDLSSFAGLFGSVSIGKQLDPNWDVRGSFSSVGGSFSGSAGAAQMYSSFTFFSGFSNFSSYTGMARSSGFSSAWKSGRSTVGWTAADFEVGYTPVLGDAFNVRLFAGIRALDFKSTFEGTSGGSSWNEYEYTEQFEPGGRVSGGSSFFVERHYFSGASSVEFMGVGPRLGAQMATRFEGTNFGLSGSVAGAVLFGNKTVSSSGYYSSYFSGVSTDYGSDYYNSAFYSSYSSSYNSTVLDMQASVGVDYYLNDNTALTVGYQTEKLWEVDPLGGSAIDQLQQGAFVKLTGTF